MSLHMHGTVPHRETFHVLIRITSADAVAKGKHAPPLRDLFMSKSRADKACSRNTCPDYLVRHVIVGYDDSAAVLRQPSDLKCPRIKTQRQSQFLGMG